jgi:glutathione S-transferase
MSLKLYSDPLSLFTAKVRIALAEKDAAYERIEVPFSRADGYEPKHPEVLRLNPKAQVPVLVNDEAGERAHCRMRELHSDEVFFPHGLTLIRGVFYADAADRLESPAITEARGAIAGHYAELDEIIAERDWIGGKFMTAADIAYRLTTLFASSLGAAPDASHTAFAAWLARIDAVPSARQEIAEIASYIGSMARYSTA